QRVHDLAVLVVPDEAVVELVGPREVEVVDDVVAVDRVGRASARERCAQDPALLGGPAGGRGGRTRARATPARGKGARRGSASPDDGQPPDEVPTGLAIRLGGCSALVHLQSLLVTQQLFRTPATRSRLVATRSPTGNDTGIDSRKLFPKLPLTLWNRQSSELV